MPRIISLFFCLFPSLVGCTPRLEVARDQVLAQVDSLLGEIEVKRKETGLGLQKAESVLDRLTRGRIEVQVSLSQISRDLNLTEDELVETDKKLARLRTLLVQDQPVEIAGSTFTPAQLRGITSRAISARKSLVDRAETLRSTKNRLASVASLLECREQNGQDRLDSLRSLLVQVDAKRAALKAVQEAAWIAQDVGALDLDAIQRQVQELEGKIDAELRFHEETLRQFVADSNSLDSLLTDTNTNAEAVAEIDKVVGKR